MLAYFPGPQRPFSQQQSEVKAKGGDWPEEKIVGAPLVRARGGRVYSLPLVPGLSTTALVNQLKSSRP